MAQSALTIQMASITMTSSAIDSSTQATPFVEVTDAVAVSAIVVGNTTAPGLIMQVALTTESTATWANLIWPSSGSGVVNITSGIATSIPISAKLLRIASTTGVTSTSYTVLLAKQVYV